MSPQRCLINLTEFDYWYYTGHITDMNVTDILRFTWCTGDISYDHVGVIFIWYKGAYYGCLSDDYRKART